ncbi:hypothetical protein SAY87_021433 [Trapa incisa]|uniref:Uncharacterized protein n=1 Tax=Trapa incisa TaxID=236973 RepID=A0AAN7JTI2_9MYRT|nr:hypothetical protein SAY87_021433 [Trapa incisa]
MSPKSNANSLSSCLDFLNATSATAVSRRSLFGREWELGSQISQARHAIDDHPSEVGQGTCDNTVQRSSWSRSHLTGTPSIPFMEGSIYAEEASAKGRNSRLFFQNTRSHAGNPEMKSPFMFLK